MTPFSRRTWVALGVAALLTAAPACGGSTDEAAGTTTRADGLTPRQRDSVTSTLPLPGAGAVGRALRASDRASERARAHDTIR
ncbi:MAG TPA: hypothetical protein VLL48_01595 [Longimicrobiales bacterium]|nr:hypothetical protein [Longimicrobiales bacterium]